MKKINLFLLIVTIMMAVACNTKSNDEANESEEKTEEQTLPQVDTTDGIFAIITTNKGTMIAKLYPEKAPMTVANFVALSEGTMPNSARKLGQPYYDSLKFHRVISFNNGDNENFMIQGGDPMGNGTGGPGYQFKDEFSDLKFDRASLLAMANSGPSTNGSQYFITLLPTPFLDGKHTIFGELVSGNEVPFNIRTNDVMQRIKIIKKGPKYEKYDAVSEFNKQK
jgi:peptidyl-prolyl cis-trans isomerase A (cyclophilin A)